MPRGAWASAWSRSATWTTVTSPTAAPRKHPQADCNDDNVFALFGYIGTPTSLAALPLAVKEKLPFFGPVHRR
jgi:hypothetical protein